MDERTAHHERRTERWRSPVVHQVSARGFPEGIGDLAGVGVGSAALRPHQT